ncbi:ArnT family glycosyltransferase [Mucilaginibacter terrae]|uniref:4-amino-4-deoxy-L-arabinose transferase-like glycosyltransferase n=1 Tax=Mucilaginibacter terrae TaxID=1955052 RepID=A0ABU3H280_9SPHI|nr:glycosyltransferase family 39 protein [Mucilaginibacter terrae]MDT3405020.1 4-amino-4-deoxy-L-arabinose transferase-like glycosyltransferase [Mucilaginibacter terrae]
MQASSSSPEKNYAPFILLFVALKLLLNMLAAGHYGFHRDELLHLTLGNHLDWGYMEVPPLIALLAKISTAVFGDAVFAARVFPAIASALMVWFTGLLTVEFGGRRFAIAVACLCMIFSPGMVASGYLFQPVVFDQFFWLMAAYLTVKYVNTNKPQYMYGLGAAMGFGLLNKYTMGFYAGALILGVLISPQRRVLFRKEVLIAVAITTLVFLPNVLWQYIHHWPIAKHMGELKTQQLDYINPMDFVMQQFMLHGVSAVVWLVGLGFLLFHHSLKTYRFVGFAYLLVYAFLLLMKGKAYYLLAGYPMLFAAGGFSIAYMIKNYIGRSVTAFAVIAPNLLLLPVVLPIFTINQTLSFFEYYHQHLPFMDFAITWEDHKKHRTTQDYADMFAWDEMAAKTAKIYYSLTPEQQKRTVIFADSYGEAGALHVYRKRYNLPEVVCLNSSFALWAPAKLNADYIIYISDDDDVSDLAPDVDSYKRMAGIENKLSREYAYGTAIYLLSGVKPSLEVKYEAHARESRLEE